MFDLDRVVTACMPLLLIAGSLSLFYRVLLFVEAWLSDLVSENKDMKARLQLSEKRAAQNRLQEVEKQLNSTLDQLKDTIEENSRLRDKSPAGRVEQSGRVLRARRLASP
jgi:predicted nuclease with TOPRIM domain